MFQNKIINISFGIFAFIIAASFFGLYNSHSAAAAPITDFKPGRIIEDSVFTNSVSMSSAQIQAFLNAKVPVCDTNGTQQSEFGGGTRAQYAANASLHPKQGAYYPPFTCLKNYSENGISSSQIIYNISQQYQINPQVLLVLLQKEQSLVTDTWPSPSQYKTATGYGCPDTAACDSQYFGLTNQLTWSAKMFRAILNNSPNWYTPYNLGNNYIRWSPTASCGGSTVNIENRSTQALYNYTPYQPNSAALNAGYGNGDGCSAYGNRNFYLYFRDWFGYNSGPAAFKSVSSSTVYVPVDGYKMAVPNMAMLNDYGVSASSIQVVDQTYLDARPTPPANTNFSSTISYVIKSPSDTDEDGGSVYLISKGQRYQFQTMQQFYNYGFTDADISYLPLSYILSKNDAGSILSFASSPSQEVFFIDATGKHMFFQYSAYIAQNPSDHVVGLSYNLLDHITSTNPLTQGPTLVKYADSDAVYLYQNSTYYLIPDYATLSQCWGFDKTFNMPIYSPSQNSYLKSISTSSTLGCVVTDGTNTYLLNGDSKYIIPSTYGLTGTTLDANLKAIIDKLPTKQRPLSTYVKTVDSPAVWNIENNRKYLIPNYANFIALGLSDSDIDTVNNNTIASFVDSGIKLANGVLVKSDNSSAVYIISNNKRILFPSGDLFSSYRNDWSSIETYPAGILDANYPYVGDKVNEYVTNTANSKAYIIGQSGCYEMNDITFNAFNVTYASITASQQYTTGLFINKPTAVCTTASKFIKLANSSLVYWVESGKKYPLNTYAAMLSKNAGQVPTIMVVSDTFTQNIPSGSIIN